MPNQSSKAAHTPIRTCVICKEKLEQDSLLSFYFLGSDIIFDIKRAVMARKRYVCNSEKCLTRLPKWLAGFRKKSGHQIKGKA